MSNKRWWAVLAWVATLDVASKPALLDAGEGADARRAPQFAIIGYDGARRRVENSGYGGTFKVLYDIGDSGPGACVITPSEASADCGALQRALVRAAMGTWNAALPFRFELVDRGVDPTVQAAIRIASYELGGRAFTNFTENAGGGPTHVWRDETYRSVSWVQGSGLSIPVVDLSRAGGFTRLEFESVVLHELGHAIGLGHTAWERHRHDPCPADNRYAIMANYEDVPGMSPGTPERTTLGTDDVDSVNLLYAAPSSFFEPAFQVAVWEEPAGSGDFLASVPEVGAPRAPYPQALYSWTVEAGAVIGSPNERQIRFRPDCTAATVNLTATLRDGGDLAGACSVRASVPVRVHDARYEPSLSTSPPATMRVGAGAAVTVSMRNTGCRLWTATDLVRLGSEAPMDNTRWGTSRVLLSAGEAVPAGAPKAFSFHVTAPSTIGTYPFSWRMLQEGVSWFGETSTTAVRVIAASGLDAMVMSGPGSSLRTVAGNPAPFPLVRGTAYRASITMRNTGDVAWRSEDGIALGYWNPGSPSPWNIERAPLANGDVIPPGQSKTFTFSIRAPYSVGDYHFRWRMVRVSGNEWFGDATWDLLVGVDY